MICKSEMDWKAEGDLFCKSKGLTLKNIAVATPCMLPGGRGFSEAKIECCK